MKNKLISVVLSVVMVLMTLLSVCILPSAADNAEKGNTLRDSDAVLLTLSADNGEYVYFTGPDTFFYQRSAHRVYAAAQRTDTTRGYIPSIYQLTDTTNASKLMQVYCCDYYTDVWENIYFCRKDLEDAAYFDDDTAEKLRAIAMTAYPFTDLAEFIEIIHPVMPYDMTGRLTQEEALAGIKVTISICRRLCC